LADERGHFARTFSADEFGERGLEAAVVQCSISFNLRAGTLRGMHFQREPHGECKLIRCTRGAIYDVLIDLRPSSETYCRWHSIELTPASGRMVYAPQGMAHGFQTLEDESEVHYQMSHPYVPSHAAGVRWDDPSFGIEWPPAERIINERDSSFPDFRP
jgi:dTDP-4-dehydrorhamnose 3,5-epimerase